MKRDLIVLGLFATIALAVLITLGFWQLQRLAWKEGLIAQIEERVEAEPVPLGTAVARWTDSKDIEYLRVQAKGRFLHDQEKHLFSVIDGKSGWRIFTPLQTSEGEIVIADRGFVPEALKAAEKRSEGQMSGPVNVVGLARKAEIPNIFTPDNAPDKNSWYWRDLEGMAESSVPPASRSKVVPFFLELEEQTVPGGWPRGGATRLKLSNNHLQYALTWFGLAAGLLLVVAVYAIGRIRHRPEP
ncbi:MAG: SURF1 family protein [Pseudomonadota bacterium]